MKLLSGLFLLTSLSVFGTSFSNAEYPLGPVDKLTPGSLCDRPDSYRYPERIPYCTREVAPELKEEIFEMYRREGYRLNPGHRSSYKVDHLIPLCAGGSNRENNLWPQHQSIYQITDPIEHLGCEKLKNGRIRHITLVRLILAAKKDLRLVPETIQYLQSL